MERSDDDIQEFINGMWPDLGFTVVDLKKPNGERFRHLLMLFLELFYGKVTFAKINFAVFTRNPEIFSHNEMGLSLFREVNALLRKLSYHNFRFNDIIFPTSAAVREVLSVLLNLATYMESNTETIEETKAMVQSLAQRQREGEKRLVEEKKHLNKCKQLAEERKMHEMELHDLVSSKKEELRQIQKEVQQQEEGANIALKRQQVVRQKLEQSEIILSQVESERSKASEEVVLDPESLFCELDSLKKEQQILMDEYNSYKERLPALEQQLRDRTEKLEEDTEMMNQLAQLKTRESKVKAEMNEQEAVLRKEEKDVSEVEAKLYREQCTIESKKRILDQNMQEMEMERISAEEEISKLRLELSDGEKRKQYHEAHVLNLEEKRHIFLEQLEVRKRGLEEIKVVSMEIDNKFEQQIAIVEKKEMEEIETMTAHIQLMINSFQSGKARRK